MHSPLISGSWQPVRPSLWGLAVSILCFLVLSANSLASSLRLVLTDSDGKAVYSCPVKNGDGFAIRYIHSVAQTPVIDYFKVKNNEIWLDRTVYQDFGAGLPHSPEKQQKLALEHGKLVLSGFERRLPDLELRIGRVANHELLFLESSARDGEPDISRAIPLSALAEPGAAIKFSIQNWIGPKPH